MERDPESTTISFDLLVGDPTKAGQLSSGAAQALLIQLAALYPLLLQRALAGSHERCEGELLLTIPQVAQRLNVSDYRAYELARQGLLRSVRLGKAVRVKPSAVEEYVARQGA